MKTTIISILLTTTLIIGALFVLTQAKDDTAQDISVSNVTKVDGKQIIEIQAKGGYQPQKSLAEANIPTIIRFNTKGTFDCSSSVNISSLSITKALPPSGTTDIDIGTREPGLFTGSCGMGMYHFAVDFQ